MRHARVGRWVSASAAISVLGMIGVALAVVLGFEEAPRGLFLVSALACLAGPAVFLLDFALTKDLSPEQKRLWLRAWTSRRGLQAISAYFASQSAVRSISGSRSK